MREFFTDSNGKLSHKRLIAAAAFCVVSAVMVFEALKGGLSVEWIYAYTAFIGAIAFGNVSEKMFKGGDDSSSHK